MTQKSVKEVLRLHPQGYILKNKGPFGKPFLTDPFDMKALEAFALAHINGDYQQIYNILKNPKVRPLDEVIRHYYLYLTSLETGDIENAEKYRNYVRANAGTTWYGMAVEEGFSPEPKPGNYPGFDIDNETLINAKKTDPKRVIINFVVITMVVVITVVKMISIFIS